MSPRFFRFASLLSLASIALAGTPIPNIIPFTVDGALDSCSSDDSSVYNSGGSISVNSFNIKVPKNLIAQFPAAWVPFVEMCAGGIAGKGYEVLVAGNVVNGEAIAAQIQVAQFLTQFGQGYIETVDIADGSLKIVGGPKVRINDPNAVYSKGYTANKLFTADDENPSITAFSGFPMCLPRSANDELCPSSNRPSGQTNFAAPDPLVMAPFLVGDFIEYSGIKDSSSGEILAYAITAINVQITTTASDTVPNYIRMEDALIGVFDNANNVEVADIRFIGFLSSCTGASVTIQAIDVHPCTGDETYRDIGTTTPRTGDARCKWEYRVDTTAQGTYTREYRIKANSPVIKTKNGIEAGQYVQPVTEWIQPEVDVPGTEPPPFRFQNIRGLVEGDFLNDKQYGPLSPFPGPAPPAPSKTCGPGDTPSNPSAVPTASAAPIANAVRRGAQVLLVGSNTASGIPNSDLVFAWSKTSPASPTIAIVDSASATATIIAPSVAASTSFVFELNVSLKSDSSKSSKANVTVKVDPAAKDIVTVDLYTWESRQSGTINVQCHSDVVNGDNKKMTLRLNGSTNLNMIAGAGAGKWTYNARSTNRPSSVQCVSDLGGTSPVVTQPTTARRRRRGELGMDMNMSPAEWV
ncbi:hypothetical protein K469DRAFT_560720 [Zopfia rhizophila CBS 207.26]|uniref:Uncharacterized protein n=1 Tax=Zopfia rhizophila CBS 207.26 TaxID=1314779 RepID=A0A6A6EDC4_9PEZI|nr:hypothetical protein K469DRAFT_560720 [Zopfia rhizophila CBS 207.26]